MNAWLQDFRFALRMLRKAPGFTAVAIFTLGLGIGANTAVFTVVNSVLLRPLPYADSERLVKMYTILPFFPDLTLGNSVENYKDIRAQNDVFEGSSMMRFENMSLTGDGEPQQVSVEGTSPELFSMLGARPAQGRLFTDAEDAEGHSAAVALLSDALWRGRFDAEPGVVGRTVRLDGKLYSIVGVMPPGFDFPRKTQLWVPLGLKPQEIGRRGMDFFQALAKLKRGVTLKRAQAELDTFAARFSQQFPDTDKDIKFTVVSLQEETVGRSRAGLLVLMGAVVLVLLIGCSNLGGLMLARSLARQKEMAVRAALGASRGRIVQQLMVESLLLALCGGTAGLLIAAYGVDLFRAFAPQDLPRRAELHMDARVFMFALVVSVLAAVFFGLAPALRGARSNVSAGLAAIGPSGATGTRSRQRLRSALVVMEVGLALVLLAGSALFLKSLDRLMRVDQGFRTDHLLTAQIALPKGKYTNAPQQKAVLADLLSRLRTLPVESVAAGSKQVLAGSTEVITVTVEGAPENPSGRADGVETQQITPGYLHTLQIPILRGRDFTEQDRAVELEGVIVNEAFARKYWPNADALGKRVGLDADEMGGREWHEVVGVVKDARDVEPSAVPQPEIFFVLKELDFGNFQVFLRTKTEPQELEAALETEARAVDNELLITGIGNMEKIIYTAAATPRFRSILLAVFAALGLLVALVGIYGVISISVTQQTREIGIRLALGAQPADVMRLMIRRGMTWVVMGTILGIGVTLGVTRWVASLLFEVSAYDPTALGTATMLLIAVALMACWIPARRAMRVDPMVALRYE